MEDEMNPLNVWKAALSVTNNPIWCVAKPLAIGTCGVAAIGVGNYLGQPVIEAAGKKMVTYAIKDVVDTGMGALAKKVANAAVSVFE